MKTKLLFCVTVLTFAICGRVESTENLLRNPGFEDELQPAWVKRTPEDASRTLRRVEGAGRTGGSAAVLENVKPAYTRLRQGNDRSIVVEPGTIRFQDEGPASGDDRIFSLNLGRPGAPLYLLAVLADTNSDGRQPALLDEHLGT